ncbi:cyanophycin synthetase family protein [Massilia endophytica]|uniref:cyanophycin synthetase family protein n=1 Tax=Massilia endophytica TaxID=2899220 RepID=UPI001E65667D|nr:hypothetical protein [Massilia endophytica]UGQ48131.1 hypothetical protein LSQ66_06610 [Massilia endophytica]
MNLIDQRYLSGPNRYCSEPCLLSILDLGHPYTEDDLQTLSAGLARTLPGLRRGRSLIGVIGDDADERSVDLRLARLIQSVAIELHRLTGDEVMVGFVGRVPRTEHRYRLILPFRCGEVANVALKLALDLVSSLLAGLDFDLKTGLARLQRLASSGAKDTIRIAA